MDGTGRAPATHPVVFLPLYLPFSLPIGFVSVALARRLHDAGVSTTGIGMLVALMIGIQLIKVLWAPIVDASFGFRRWYAMAAVLSALAIAAIGATPADPASLPALTVLAVVLSIAGSFMGMATEGLMAYATQPDARGRAGGWSQAGNLLGGAVGGGAGLWLATHLHPQWAAGAVLGLIPLTCAGALAFVHAPNRRGPDAPAEPGLVGVAKDAWGMLRSRQGRLTLLLFALPVGCGAAANLVGALAGDWKVSADLLAALAGLGSGTASVVGAIIGGYVCDRLDRKTAYLAFGFLLAAIALGMALAPRTPLMFVAFALAYAAASGLVQAAFAAVTLETIGLGAAATKFTLFAALNNAPFAYMALVEGWAHTRWNAGAMLALEGAMGIGSGLAFIAVVLATRRRRGG